MPKIPIEVLRERYHDLMVLPRNRVNLIQAKAVWGNYTEGTGRLLGKTPKYYETIGYRGNTVVNETYFSYIDRVH